MREIIILISLATLFGASSLVGLGNTDFPLDPNILRLRYILVGASLLSLILISRFQILKLYKTRALPLLIIWLSLSFILVISGVINNDSILVRDGFWMMIGVPSIFFGILPNLIQKNNYKQIAWALLLGLIPYIVASVILHPITPSLYRGVFANSNQMGSACASISAGLFILLTTALHRKKPMSQILLLVALLVGNLLLILMANSRTSLLAFASMSSISFIRLVVKPKELVRVVVFSIAAAIPISLFFDKQIYLLWRDIEQGIIAKIGEADSLSGRGEIWSETLKDINLFGHGSDYFETHFNIGGHNTIIDILGVSGILAAYLLIGLLVASFLYAYDYLKLYKNEDSYALAPLLITTCFWILAMGESMFGSLGTAMTLAYMLSLGIVVQRLNKGEVRTESII